MCICYFLNFALFKFWSSEKLKGRRRAPENDEDPHKHLQNLGYEFHIDQKSWNGNLVTFVFSSKGSHPSTCHYIPTMKRIVQTSFKRKGQNEMGTSLNILFSYLRILNFEKWKVCVHNFENVELLDFQIVECLRFADFPNFKKWTSEIWKCWNFEKSKTGIGKGWRSP